MKILTLSIITAIFFISCATITPINTKSVAILIKSKMLKINDAGFIHFYKNSLNLQLYKSGQNILNLVIKDKICLNNACENKRDFNAKFFQNAHYDDILIDILNAAPIYKGKNLTQTNCGFTQNLRNLAIKYAICDNETLFFDEKNGVKIIIKGLK